MSVNVCIQKIQLLSKQILNCEVQNSALKSIIFKLHRKVELGAKTIDHLKYYYTLDSSKFDTKQTSNTLIGFLASLDSNYQYVNPVEDTKGGFLNQLLGLSEDNVKREFYFLLQSLDESIIEVQNILENALKKPFEELPDLNTLTPLPATEALPLSPTSPLNESFSNINELPSKPKIESIPVTLNETNYTTQPITSVIDSKVDQDQNKAQDQPKSDLVQSEPQSEKVEKPVIDSTLGLEQKMNNLNIATEEKDKAQPQTPSPASTQEQQVQPNPASPVTIQEQQAPFNPTPTPTQEQQIQPNPAPPAIIQEQQVPSNPTPPTPIQEQQNQSNHVPPVSIQENQNPLPPPPKPENIDNQSHSLHSSTPISNDNITTQHYSEPPANNPPQPSSQQMGTTSISNNHQSNQDHIDNYIASSPSPAVNQSTLVNSPTQPIYSSHAPNSATSPNQSLNHFSPNQHQPIHSNQPHHQTPELPPRQSFSPMPSPEQFYHQPPPPSSFPQPSHFENNYAFQPPYVNNPSANNPSAHSPYHHTGYIQNPYQSPQPYRPTHSHHGHSHSTHMPNFNDSLAFPPMNQFIRPNSTGYVNPPQFGFSPPPPNAPMVMPTPDQFIPSNNPPPSNHQSYHRRNMPMP